MDQIQPRKIHVFGAGTMGAGIAQFFVQQGVAVTLWDSYPAVLERANTSLLNSWNKLVEKNKFTHEQVATFKSNLQLRPLTDLTSAQDCDWVIEAIVENLELKINLFQTLDTYYPAQCLWLSNTSSLSIGQLRGRLPKTRQNTFFGMHFFNPAPIMKLVELISPEELNNPIALELKNTLLAMGKKPVICQDQPGFIVNRLARNYYGEAMRIAESQVDFSIIDSYLEAVGFPMGPFALMDLIGLDVNLEVTRQVWQAFGSPPRLAPHHHQEMRVKAGQLGKKTSEGFYSAKNPRKKILPLANLELPLPNKVAVIFDTNKNWLYDSVKGNSFSHFLINNPQDITSLDLVNHYCFDLTSFEKENKLSTLKAIASKGAKEIWSDTSHLCEQDLFYNLPFLDGLLATHFPTPNKIVECKFLQKVPNDSLVLAFLTQLKLKAFDTSAMTQKTFILPRLLSLIINESYLALEDKLSRPEDMDLALQFGVNYPLGPWQWQKLIGTQLVFKTLINFQKDLGLRYSPAQTLKGVF